VGMGHEATMEPNIPGPEVLDASCPGDPNVTFLGGHVVNNVGRFSSVGAMLGADEGDLSGGAE
jgi:hypothetical protein